MKVLVTGASGFVGGAVLTRLVRHGCDALGAVRADRTDRTDRTDRVAPAAPAVRHAMPATDAGLRYVEVASLGADTDWSHALAGIDVVVHAAARVHVMQDGAADPLAEYRRTNVAGTLGLARQAVAAGVRRFIFISSIKVNGEETRAGVPFAADDIPAPCDPYGMSKLEAERALHELALASGLEVVIIRPPLVYGPGVKANFQAMMRWLEKGVPLPFGAVNNRRSLVALENLVDLIECCMHHPAAANQIFLVSDGEDLSTSDLLRRMAHALGKPARLMPVPPGLLKLSAALVGKSAVGQRLCGSLQVDIRKTQEILGWHPVVSVDLGLEHTARHFRQVKQI